MDYYFAVLGKYVDFNGRARRAECWTFQVINGVLILVLMAIDNIVFGNYRSDPNSTVGAGILAMLYLLAVLLPSVAVMARRLHDTNRSAWWMLIAFVPVFGPILLLTFLLQDSDPGVNKYGPNPKEMLAA